MTYRPDFNGCWAKWERAWEHRETLNSEILPLVWTETYPVTLSAKFDSQSGEHIFRVAQFPEHLLMRFGLVVGDCVHNFRSALDYLVWQLSVYGRDGRKPRKPKKVQFPIMDIPPADMESPKDFLGGGTLCDVLPAHRAIIEGWQPYNPYQGWKHHAGHPFAILRDLSNRDKHQMVNEILLATGALTKRGGAFEGVPIIEFEALSQTDGFKVGADAARFRFPPVTRRMWKWQATRDSA